MLIINVDPQSSCMQNKIQFYWQVSATFKAQTEKPILVFKISRKTLKADHNDFLFPTRTSWNFKLAVLDIITSVGGKKVAYSIYYTIKLEYVDRSPSPG